jgi:hypothetical protein
MADEPADRTATQAAEAWLDLVLLATALALAPYEFGARLLIAWSRLFDPDS